NILPSWGNLEPPKLPEPSKLLAPKEEPELEEKGKNDPALKRLVETRRISDQDLCIDHLAIISETYLYREDSLAIFKDVENQISNIYRRELARLEDIKIKIVLIAHIYQIVQEGHFGHQIDQDIAFPSSSYFALPKIWAKPQLGIINPQNTDDQCFEACIKAYLASKEFEENNPSYLINIFYLAPPKNNKEQATRKINPLCISEYNYQREHMVNLILFTKEEEDLRDRRNINKIPLGLNTYYCLINGKNDLKADSDLVENNIINEKTIKLQKQKPNSYSYALIQTDGKLAKEIVRQTLNSIAES
ncbi:15622_t:CDS:2, partial [Dentiscutata heterogama]